MLGERNSILACAGDKKYTPIVKDPEETYACQVISPILCEGDVIGGVIFLVRDGKKKLGEVEQKMASWRRRISGKTDGTVGIFQGSVSYLVVADKEG